MASSGPRLDRRFETAFQPFAALGFPEPVLKTVDEQNRRVAALDGNRGAGNKVFSLPKPCSSLPVRHLLAAFLTPLPRETLHYAIAAGLGAHRCESRNHRIL
jgi:hypothetical protein